MDYSVAIIIPTLNEERFIASCLDSVINQSFPFKYMDVMVIDGGSSDRTQEVVLDYCTKYSNIRLLSNSGRIQAKAFNLGVKESNAPYIIRLDAHAVYKSYYIERCLNRLKEDCNRGNVGGHWEIRPQGRSLWAITNAILNYSKFGIGGATYRVGAKAGNVDTVPFGAFPRIVIERIGGMREDLPRGEDNEFNSRIRKAGYSIYFDPEIECIYYARPTLQSSCKQMFANGESIGHLIFIDRDAIGFRHLVPMLFVSSIIIGTIVSLFYRPFFYILAAGALLYFACDLVASIVAARTHGWKYCMPLFVSFFCVHVSYGIGTIKGLLDGWKKQRRI